MRFLRFTKKKVALVLGVSLIAQSLLLHIQPTYAADDKKPAASPSPAAVTTPAPNAATTPAPALNELQLSESGDYHGGKYWGSTVSNERG